MKPVLLQVKNLSKSYSRTGLEQMPVLESIDFSIEDSGEGRIVSILAPMRSGKTTLLRLISGIEKSSAGEILILGKNYKYPSGEIAYLPEEPSHFPWLTVQENINLISQIRNEKLSPDLVSNLIALIGLTGYENHIPHNRSYGFRVRTALGRALAANPKIVLLDDVFKNIDVETKDELYIMLKEIKNKLKITFILATASVTESLILSDQIFLMQGRPGRIISQINPERLKKISGNTNMEEFTTVRKEIESAYQIENFSGSINISI